jgi:hypothetical protein
VGGKDMTRKYHIQTKDINGETKGMGWTDSREGKSLAQRFSKDPPLEFEWGEVDGKLTSWIKGEGPCTI